MDGENHESPYQPQARPQMPLPPTPATAVAPPSPVAFPPPSPPRQPPSTLPYPLQPPASTAAVPPPPRRDPQPKAGGSSTGEATIINPFDAVTAFLAEKREQHLNPVEYAGIMSMLEKTVVGTWHKPSFIES